MYSTPVQVLPGSKCTIHLSRWWLTKCTVHLSRWSLALSVQYTCPGGPWLQVYSTPVQVLPGSPSSVLLLPFSSGTTGRPKAVELSHRWWKLPNYPSVSLSQELCGQHCTDGASGAGDWEQYSGSADILEYNVVGNKSVHRVGCSVQFVVLIVEGVIWNMLCVLCSISLQWNIEIKLFSIIFKRGVYFTVHSLGSIQNNCRWE